MSQKGATPFFSVVTPVHNRVEDGRLKRCLDSVLTQTFADWEHIIVDDGSTEDVGSLVNEYDDRFKLVRQEHKGRVIARNRGLAEAKGRWLCWLDSDDALDPMYLAAFHYHIQQNPEVSIWLCGAIVHGMGVDKETKRHTIPTWTKIRHPHIPPLSDKGVHSHFDSGTIGTGMFVYSREAMERIGPMPDWANFYEVADGCNEWLGYQTPYSAAKRWCGNPWGEDWVYIRKLSMHYWIHSIEAALYVQYVRSGEAD